jgi:hypothetical protein
LRRRISLEIQRTEINLGFRVPLLCGLFKPLLRLPIALGYTLTYFVQQTESVLSRHVPFLGSLAEFLGGRLVFGAIL